MIKRSNRSERKLTRRSLKNSAKKKKSKATKNWDPLKISSRDFLKF